MIHYLITNTENPGTFDILLVEKIKEKEKKHLVKLVVQEENALK